MQGWYLKWAKRSSGFISNFPEHRRALLEQAIAETGYPLYIREDAVDRSGYPMPGDVALYTTAPKQELGPFWAVYERLKAEVGE